MILEGFWAKVKGVIKRSKLKKTTKREVKEISSNRVDANVRQIKSSATYLHHPNEEIVLLSSLPIISMMMKRIRNYYGDFIIPLEVVRA